MWNETVTVAVFIILFTLDPVSTFHELIKGIYTHLIYSGHPYTGLARDALHFYVVTILFTIQNGKHTESTEDGNE